MLKPDLAQAIGVSLHELASNAAKYGALSVAEGQVRVEWSRAEDGQLVVRWTEAGGPQPPTRKGFGTSMTQSIINGVKGRVQLDWRAEGLTCEIALPTGRSGLRGQTTLAYVDGEGRATRTIRCGGFEARSRLIATFSTADAWWGPKYARAQDRNE